jgi:hypothetical protein
MVAPLKSEEARVPDQLLNWFGDRRRERPNDL